MARTFGGGSSFLAAAALLAAQFSPAVADERLRLPPPARGDSVGNCAVHGPGFVQIAGTDSCVRLGGRVRAEGLTRNGATSTMSGGRVTLDVRVPTGLGPMRGYMSGTASGN